MTQIILIVEYDHETRVRYREVLEHLHHNVVSVASGREGMDFLSKNTENIAVVLLCLRMPIMDGNEFLKQMEDDPKLRDIPTFMVAYEPNKVRKSTTVLMRKPIADDDLRRIINDILTQKRHGVEQ